MEPPTPARLLEIWERAEPLAPVERAVALATLCAPSETEAELASLPLGTRDARLLDLHSRWRGPRLDSIAVCPGCEEQVEFAPEVAAIVAESRAARAPAAIEVDGLVVTWRPPDSLDMLAAGATGDVRAAEQTILDRCVSTPGWDEGTVAPAVREAVVAAMAAADPVADVLVDLECPACGARFTAELDIAQMVWSEATSEVRRLLHEVDSLARAYGWTEGEVLRLGQARRDAYLRLAEATA